VAKLKNYTVKRMETIIDQQRFSLWHKRTFTELRDLVVSRLTLFNVRRGGEPARLSLTEWAEAESDIWLNDQAVRPENDIDRKLFLDLKITFQTGKGNNHLVPVLIPEDSTAAMKLLADKEVRESSGISLTNNFMFPSAKFQRRMLAVGMQLTALVAVRRLNNQSD
jgi:hypothetical protein